MSQNSPLTPDTVALAYRLLLGREPENQAVLDQFCGSVRDLAQLRQVFLDSPEFRQRMAATLDKSQPQVRQRHPFHLPQMPVELDATPAELVQMLDRVKAAWERFGDTEPYWSVVTQPMYRMEQIEAHRKSFYHSGKYSCDLFLAALRRCGINPAELGSCLEVGCGVGRVTRYLAEAFPRLIAADVSGAHLGYAREWLQQEGLSNVEWRHWTDPAALQQLPAVDVVFSLITLQHNPPPVMAWMLRALLAALNHGGVAYLQLPTYSSGYLFEVKRYLNMSPQASMEMHFLPQHEVFAIVQASGCICLEVREDTMVGDEDRMLSNTFLIRKPGRSGS